MYTLQSHVYFFFKKIILTCAITMTHTNKGIIDGSCDAAELTKEDLFKWTNLEHNATRRCVPTIVGIPIVRRHRGMMVSEYANQNCCPHQCPVESAASYLCHIMLTC